MVRLDDLVNNDGEITTINELDKRGLIVFRKCDKFYSPRKQGLVTKYFADVRAAVTDDASSGWEISKYAYESKVRQGDLIDTRTMP